MDATNVTNATDVTNVMGDFSSGKKSRRLRSLPFKRRRANKTDYKARLALLKSGKTRLVIRLTNRRAIAQLVKYDAKGDRTIVQADSIDLTGIKAKAAKTGEGAWIKDVKFGRNTLSCYLVGALCAARAADAGIKEAVVDVGLRNPVKGGRIFAMIKGAADAGLSVSLPPNELLPSPERIRGKLSESDFRTLASNIKNLAARSVKGAGAGIKGGKS